MKIISDVVVYLLMISAVVGCFYSITDRESELGKQFIAGIESIGSLFIPIAGIMASLPLISVFVTKFIAPIFSLFGADPAIAATTLLAVDMGGYQLADSLANSKEAWIFAMTVGYMAGATIVFSIPVATKMVDKKYHKELAIGMMFGFLAIPFGVLITNLLIMFLKPEIRTVVSSDPSTSVALLKMTVPMIITNLVPLIIICVILAFGLWRKPDSMIKGFQRFSFFIESFTKIVLMISILEYFTGIVSTIFKSYPFDPIIADAFDQERALEVAGYIGLMLSGALPMVYLIENKLRKPINQLADKLNVSNKIMTGILAASANVIAAFSMINDDMKSEDIVSIVAFSVCGAFVIGDHLAFTANFQPQLILPIVFGKLIAGIIAVIFSKKLFKLFLIQGIH